MHIITSSFFSPHIYATIYLVFFCLANANRTILLRVDIGDQSLDSAVLNFARAVSARHTHGIVVVE